MEKIAAIDIGSNAIRLTTAKLVDKNKIIVDDKIRIPIRLGTQAFSVDQQFSSSFMSYSQNTFKAIRKTIDNLKVTRLRTFATSALRDAKNSSELIDLVKKASGIQIHVIPGGYEANLILKAIQNSHEIDIAGNYLLFDLGGGSLELSLVEDHCIMESLSIDLGTVRFLEYRKNHHTEQDLDAWMNEKLFHIKRVLRDQISGRNSLTVVGTGGNFRRLMKLKNMIYGQTARWATLSELQQILMTLQKTTFLERIQRYDLRPDRADVIIPALKIINKVIGDLPVEKITAPQIGLSQGILIDMVKKNENFDQILTF